MEAGGDEGEEEKGWEGEEEGSLEGGRGYGRGQK